MRPDCVVVFEPFLDHDFGLLQSVEDFASEQLMLETYVEAPDVALTHTLPGRRCKQRPAGQWRSWHQPLKRFALFLNQEMRQTRGVPISDRRLRSIR